MSLANVFLLLDAIVFAALGGLTWNVRADPWPAAIGVALMVVRVVATWHQQIAMRERADY